MRLSSLAKLFRPRPIISSANDVWPAPSGAAITEDIKPFAFNGSVPPAEAQLTDTERLFWNNSGPVVHKWLHYLPIYDRYFQPWKNKPVRMLELGVSRGGSLKLWRDLLGPHAVIFGIDVDPTCAVYNGQHGQVRIGSQDDPEFLRSVVAEMGGIDIVLDDGSHIGRHMNASLQTLFPLLVEGGLYLIEDTHTSYWSGWEGGYEVPGGFLETVKVLIDDMHHWYHGQGQRVSGTRDHLAAMHVYDSIVVLEKARVAAPVHAMRGQGK